MADNSAPSVLRPIRAASDALPESTSAARFHDHRVGIAFLVFAGYYLGARLGLAFTFLPQPISVLWPPNAILFAALLLVPRNQWWVVIGAALPAHLLAEMQGGIPFPMVCCWFVSNVAEAFIGATTARLLSRGPITLTTPRNVVVFLVAAVVSAFLSSFLDSAFVVWNGWGESGYWAMWTRRLVANVTADVTIVPLIITFAAGGIELLRPANRARAVEATVLTVSLVLVAHFVFNSAASPGSAPAKIYLPLPLLLWTAFRFGPAGASAAFVIVAFVAIWGAGHGTGALGTHEAHENAHAVQLFLISLGPTLLCLAAAILERRQSAEYLRLSDRRFQVVLQATKGTVYERDLESGRLWWSRNRLMHFGYAYADRCDQLATLADRIHPDDRMRALQHLLQALGSNERRWEHEFRLRRADGTYAHVHEQGFVVCDDSGKPVQVIAALADVTERHDAEELNHRLAHASRMTAMGEMAASIAHEINQPMSAILNNVDSADMLLEAARPDVHLVREILCDVRSDHLRVSEIVRNIRALVNKREIEVEAVPLDEMFRSLQRLATPVARRRSVALRMQSHGAYTVRADRIHIQQVLLNLAFNAMDAVATAPVERRVIEIDAHPGPGTMVEVTVSDRGHGIPPDHLRRIFESFFTTKLDGMGLGLSIARTLVEAHGGTIDAQNHPEGGAIFRFTLPLATGE